MWTTGPAQTPSVRVTKNAAQAIASGVPEDITWEIESWDTNDMHSSTNNNRLYARIAGIYEVTASIDWAAGTTGYREIEIFHNTAADVETRIALERADASADNPSNHCHAIYNFAADEYVEIRVEHTQSTDVDVESTVSWATMVWLGPPPQS